jgi:general secretion pathway protein K
MSALPRRQRGVALLVALLVVALAVILIAALLDRGELALARTRNLLRAEQAEAYALGLEQYAAQVLVASKNQSQNLDTNASIWAQPLPPQPVPGGVIGATMRDMNGCFNLNNLSPTGNSALWDPVFLRLLTVLGIDSSLDEAIEGWLGTPSSDADANYYLALPVPYRPRNGLFAHVSELRLVRGVTGDIYARLAPYVCALPAGTKLNINTASVPVLQSLAEGMTRATAERLWQNGNAQYGAVDSNFLDQASIPSGSSVESLLAVKSQYFLARGDIALDDVPFTFYSLIEFDSGPIRVVERSRGSDDALVAPAPVAADAASDSALR